MADQSHIWLENPETGGVWACPVSVADIYRDKRGWVETDEPDSEEYPEDEQAPTGEPVADQTQDKNEES